MDEDIDISRMSRAVHTMPEEVATALQKRGLTEKYRARPAYQQNDYVGWIGRAKLPATRQKRLAQMLDELERGGTYMNMSWSGGRRAE